MRYIQCMTYQQENPNWAPIREAMIGWRGRVGLNPTTSETMISPLGVDGRVTSDVGERDRPNANATRNHPGTDFAPVSGGTRDVPVRAAMSGEVLFFGTFNNLLGDAVFIGADNGEVHVYGHLWPLGDDGIPNLRVGDRVTQGQVFAEMGSTGNVTGPCLHFVVRRPHDMSPQDFEAALEDPQLLEVMLVEAENRRFDQLSDYRNGYQIVVPEIDGRPLRDGMRVAARPAPALAETILAEAELGAAGVTGGVEAEASAQQYDFDAQAIAKELMDLQLLPR